jgi:hypothetical protein
LLKKNEKKNSKSNSSWFQKRKSSWN